MTNRFRVSSTLPRRLEELGISPEAVLRRSKLPEELLRRERILVTTEELFALYQGIADVSRDPGIGLKLGTEDRVELYDPIAIAALHARTYRDALQRLARYKQLVCPEKLHIVERGDKCAIRFEWLLTKHEEPAVLVDVCFAWVVNVGRRGTGLPLHPVRVELDRAPAHRRIYETHFRCPVTFESRRNVVVFNRADLDRPFQTHNPDLLAVVAPQLESELAQKVEETSLPERIRGALKRQLAGQRPELRRVARELGLSTRTLQRRLTEQGITFQQLLEQARRDMARHYLLHSRLELNETAYLLGYEDSNSFFRAFHDWEGRSPGEWRARHARSAHSRSGAPAGLDIERA